MHVCVCKWVACLCVCVLVCAKGPNNASPLNKVLIPCLFALPLPPPFLLSLILPPYKWMAKLCLFHNHLILITIKSGLRWILKGEQAEKAHLAPHSCHPLAEVIVWILQPASGSSLKSYLSDQGPPGSWAQLLFKGRFSVCESLQCQAIWSWIESRQNKECKTCHSAEWWQIPNLSPFCTSFPWQDLPHTHTLVQISTSLLKLFIPFICMTSTVPHFNLLLVYICKSQLKNCIPEGDIQ